MPVGRDRTRMQPGLHTYAVRASPVCSPGFTRMRTRGHARRPRPHTYAVRASPVCSPGFTRMRTRGHARRPRPHTYAVRASILLVDLLSQLLHDVRIPLAGVIHLLAELVVVVLRQAGALGDDVDHLGAGARLLDDVVHTN